jgi:alkanesulfonate monooxygenase SsuD/methylene tetrahydromethanopterin reductase-like flavin-dependent oxidoreductase (luciferase family)
MDAGVHRAGPVPLWIGSWGSAAGLRRVARLGDGWLASAYNTTPADGFPNALVTMWTWITEDRAEAERVITGRLAPLLKRDPATLRGRVCVGPAGMCAELLSGYAEAGCRRESAPDASRRPTAAQTASGGRGR